MGRDGTREVDELPPIDVEIRHNRIDALMLRVA
jgi:hypothetical protein